MTSKRTPISIANVFTRRISVHDPVQVDVTTLVEPPTGSTWVGTRIHGVIIISIVRAEVHPVADGSKLIYWYGAAVPADGQAVVVIAVIHCCTLVICERLFAIQGHQVNT